MAVINNSFSAAVDDWCIASEARMEAVFRESCQRLVNTAQAGAPHDTGFLISSLTASVGTPTPMRDDAVPQKGETYSENPEVILTIAGLKVGEIAFFCYVAAYARRLEYGFTGKDSLGRSYAQAARGWVRLAAQQWASIVAQVITEAKNRASGG